MLRQTLVTYSTTGGLPPLIQRGTALASAKPRYLLYFSVRGSPAHTDTERFLSYREVPIIQRGT